MKTNSKVLIATILAACAMCAFIFYPFMCTDLHLKIYFSNDSAPTECSLYYTTAESPSFSEDKLLIANITASSADIILPKNLCGKLENVRLDFAYTDSLIGIKHIELRSAGFARNTLDASQFFDQTNIYTTNDLSALQHTSTVTYIGTAGGDPFIIFQPNIVQEFNDAYSHYTGTKAFICLYFVITILLAHKKVFSEE